MSISEQVKAYEAEHRDAKGRLVIGGHAIGYNPYPTIGGNAFWRWESSHGADWHGKIIRASSEAECARLVRLYLAGQQPVDGPWSSALPPIRDNPIRKVAEHDMDIDLENRDVSWVYAKFFRIDTDTCVRNWPQADGAVLPCDMADDERKELVECKPKLKWSNVTKFIGQLQVYGHQDGVEGYTPVGAFGEEPSAALKAEVLRHVPDCIFRWRVGDEFVQ